MKRAINTFFDRVYVINLRSRDDRRSEMSAQLQRIHLSLESPDVVLFEATKPSEQAGFPSVGARGCFMSHLAVLRDARDRRLSSVLILEDDLNFCEEFNSRFDTVAICLESVDWGLFYGSYLLGGALAPSHTACVEVDPDSAIGTSAFVAINGKHLNALVQYLEAMLARPPGDPRGGPMHIDGAYYWFRRAHPAVSTWLAAEPLGFQRSSRTDVHALRWYDELRWSAWLVSKLRRLRNEFRHGTDQSN
jgi:hypothetical protein